MLAAHPFEKPQICRLQGDQHGLIEPVRGRGGVLSIIVKRRRIDFESLARLQEPQDEIEILADPQALVIVNRRVKT